MAEYKELADEHTAKTYYHSNGYYILPYKNKDGNITYYTAEALNRGKEINKQEIPKYSKLKGVETQIFNERYLYTGERYLFIVERNI